MLVLKWVLRNNHKWVILSFLAAVASNLSQIIYMFFVGELVNRIEERSAIERSFYLLMAGFLIANAVTQYLCQLSGRYTAERLAHTLRMGFLRAKVYQKGRESKNGDAASAMSVVQNELSSANDYLSNTFFDMIGMSISGILVFVCLMIVNAKLTMVILLPTLLILGYVLWTGGKLSKVVAQTLEEKNRMNRVAYSAIRPVKVDPETGYRYYSADQVRQVESLLELQEMGFSLNEIEQILSGKLSKNQIVALFDEKEIALQEMIWKTEAKLEEVKAIRENMENGPDALRIKEMTDEERAWYLAKLVVVSDKNVRQAISEAIWV